MAITKSDIPKLLLPGLQTIFFDAFQEAGTNIDRVATMVHSTLDTENYAWLGALPGVSEFLDERKIADMSPYSYALKNRTWESTIAIDRAAMEDDQYGQIALRVRQMAQAARQHMSILTYQVLAAGWTGICYDGAPFFGNHTFPGQAVQSNKGTDTLGATTLQNAITVMMRFLDDQGKPAGIVPDTLIVPPELYWEATQLMNSAFFPDPVSGANQLLAVNALKGLMTVVVAPELADTVQWFLCDSKRMARAIIFQMRKDFEFSALEADTENGFMRDQYLYGVRARYNVGYGDWRACYGEKSD